MVRNIDKIEDLKEPYGEENFSKIEFVEADIQNSDKMIEACESCTHILHIANPVPGDEKERVMSSNQMINQASIGMLSIIQSCKQYKIKKLVVTSCASNIIGTAWKKNQDPSDTKYDEGDFTGDHQYDELDGYMKSKIR